MKCVVADAGPLIGLGRVGQLTVLESLCEMVLIPPRVAQELRPESDRPGARRLRDALEAGWLRVRSLESDAELVQLTRVLDGGEAEALLLAEQVAAAFLLVDDRVARATARSRGVRVVGTGGLLVAAKKAGLLTSVGPILESLADAGYRLSTKLRQRIRELAGEA